jgi:Rrf2 family protein
MALRYISGKHRRSCDSEVGTAALAIGCASAREIADAYGLPFEITAKTLQRLKDLGLIQSTQGARGGYTLHKSLGSVTLAEYLEMMEGSRFLATCAGELEEGDVAQGEFRPRCEMRQVLGDLNSRILRFFSGIRLVELTDSPVHTSVLAPVAFMTQGDSAAPACFGEEP